MSYAVAKKINPGLDYTSFQANFIAPPKCRHLAEYIQHANQEIALLQTRKQLRWATLDLFEQLAAENIIYAEIRFAPLLHLQAGLSPREVVQVVNEAVKEGCQQTGIEAGIILATLRHFNEAQSRETAQLVQDFKGSKIVGLDLAADEAAWPIDAHRAAFDFAERQQLNITAHAGEAKGPESVWETLRELHAQRLGHGVRSIEDPQLIDYLKQQHIHLEICPTSNIQTNVFNRITDHPVNALYQAGISLSINTDGRTIANTSLSQEYQLLARHFGWTRTHFLHCNLEAVKHAFTSKSIKTQLRQQLLAAYA